MLVQQTGLRCCEADPPRSLHAARVLGRLVGRGMLSAAECAGPLGASAAAAPGRDAGGLRARLLHALADAAGAERALADGAVRRVRAALRPGLAAGLPASVLRACARRAAAGVLSPREIDRVAAGAMRAALSGARHGR